MTIFEVTQKNITLDRLFTDQFKYDKDRKLFIGNLSRLRPANLFRNIYQNDMITVGFILVSSRTKLEKIFHLTNTVRLDDGQPKYWIFSDEVRSDLKVKVINDS